jgi:hypothetical protein
MPNFRWEADSGCHSLLQGHSRLLSLVPRAIEVCAAALESDDERLATATATKILEGAQVLGGIEQMFEFAKQASPEADRQHQRLLFLGQMTDMALHKSRRFGTPLPPEYDKMEAEVKKRMDSEIPATVDDPAGVAQKKIN